MLEAVAAASKDVAFAAGQGGVVLRTMDAGATWIVLPSCTTSGITGLAAETPFQSHNAPTGDPMSNNASVVWLVGRNGAACYSTNGGTTWEVQVGMWFIRSVSPAKSSVVNWYHT